MSSFSARHAPPYPAAGPEIPPNVRGSLLGWFAETYNVTPTEVAARLRHAEGFSAGPGSIADDIMDRFGEEAAQTFVDQIKYGPGLEGWSYQSDQDAVSLLRGVPTPLFLDALEYALGLLGRVPSGEWRLRRRWYRSHQPCLREARHPLPLH